MNSLRVLSGIFATMLLMSVTALSDDKNDILQQKKELEQIQKEVAESHKKLESLKKSELDVQSQITEADQRIHSNRKVISRLNKELNALQNQIKQTEEELTAFQLHLDLSHRRYLGNIRQFYLAAHRPSEIFAEDPNEELLLNRQIVYLTSVATFEAGNIDQASQLLAQTIGKAEDLTGESHKVADLKKKKETATALASTQKAKQEKNLEQIRRQKTEEGDRIVMLEQAAREMEKIIARLQEEIERSRAGQPDTGPSIFASLKGQLLSPYRGKITETFGQKTDPITNLKSFSPSITIKGKPGADVDAVAAGTVAYVGNLRGYGNFVILSHDGRYYTTYAGLGKTLVTSGEYVLAGNKLAVSDASGVVKFEVREGRTPLDPVEWIRIDSF